MPMSTRRTCRNQWLNAHQSPSRKQRARANIFKVCASAKPRFSKFRVPYAGCRKKRRKSCSPKQRKQQLFLIITENHTMLQLRFRETDRWQQTKNNKHVRWRVQILRVRRRKKKKTQNAICVTTTRRQKLLLSSVPKTFATRSSS